MPTSFHVRDYRDADAAGWLRCRLLSFFPTDYYDDVVTRRPSYDPPALRRVAIDGADVVGLLDATISPPRATIEVLAVHPDHQRLGVASALLAVVVGDLRPYGVRELDAWTREDVAANGWYHRSGFVERFSYLHVYKGFSDDGAGFTCPDGLTGPFLAYCQAPRELETSVRARFSRVYVCRQYVREL
ncbi:Ribosomal protein S18 acetylase RimI [Actinopolymorpha cephalotaxi]|uniref:Ribosomal protein S18 acetylase RimI n=1 Tax=Actinopolymorpha cephalotaxi TaxID=504797 RepID=A0A1I2NDX7_9ACTN|nr:GNAT family N-acetyltransferase [Actinopolymorpha cephalotaxi]NYH85646.1 ribosomal protein S18 acetylase RimI-like enzyme [Actinopolymorpha cephalotaxi]SFF99716.1 Ribosomal protein S18 acetylase RimI [Actinopolymorpha cephalotaxi]